MGANRIYEIKLRAQTHEYALNTYRTLNTQMVFDRMNSFVYINQWPEMNSSSFCFSFESSCCCNVHYTHLGSTIVFTAHMLKRTMEIDFRRIFCVRHSKIEVYFLMIQFQKCSLCTWCLKNGIFDKSNHSRKTEFDCNKMCPDVSFHLILMLAEFFDTNFVLRTCKNEHRSICLQGSFDWSVGRSVELGDKKQQTIKV